MNASEPLIGLLGATFRTHNRGVSALTESAIQCALARWPEARITLIDYEREPRVHHLQVLGRPVEVPLLNLRFSRRLFLPNNIVRLLLSALLARLVPLAGWKRRLLERNAALRAIGGMDLVASLALGDSFSDLYGLRRFLYVCLPQVLVLLLGRRLVLLPQTLGPFRRRSTRLLARWVLLRAERVYSRDRPGLAEMRAWLDPNGSGERLRFCHDLAFVLDPRAPRAGDDPGRADFLPRTDGAPARLVGLNASGLLYMGGYTRDNMFGIGSEYPRLIREVLEYLLGQPDTGVLLVPHVFGAPRNPESDEPACEALYEEYAGRSPGRLFLARGEYDHREIKHIIGRCDFFIGSRMHACIAALSQGIPAIGLAYSRKFAGVFEALGLEELVADLRELDEARVIGRIEAALQAAPQLRRRLREVLPGVTASVLGLFGELPAAARGAARVTEV